MITQDTRLTTMGEAFDAAEAAWARGDMEAFELHARQWVRTLHGSREAGDEAIAFERASLSFGRAGQPATDLDALCALVWG